MAIWFNDLPALHAALTGAGRLRRMVMTAESKIVDHGTDIWFLNQAQRNALPWSFGPQGRNLR